ncbi:ferric reductase-like transmembrane domain-containing protein [Kineosporia sp. J2-2]|uniref:Ferric reductase-like transmembrane domain-containing protein n=1 Tax=Kineosporia corallincola TaxID=2835133 RepID=A0ABS5TQV1_9ACTN|nr:ferric reductase-like transmembrane domain-containing protein [Kineosporia corallincola]MBT0773039.1 ferric reductase-like transmembrane domain-containing protein [Kineosporia corallincola]
MTTEALWYLARGSGVVSLILFTVVVVLGIGTRSGRTFAGMNRLVVASVHRSAALLALVFLVIHVVTLLFDPYAQLNLIDLLLPFGSGYRPFWVGLGTLALDLALAVTVTSLLRDRIGLRAWRAVHWLAYAMWPVAVLHGIGSGTDRGTFWMLAIDAVCVLSVVAVAVAAHPALRPKTRTPVATSPRKEHQR